MQVARNVQNLLFYVIFYWVIKEVFKAQKTIREVQVKVFDF